MLFNPHKTRSNKQKEDESFKETRNESSSFRLLLTKCHHDKRFLIEMELI